MTLSPSEHTSVRAITGVLAVALVRHALHTLVQSAMRITDAADHRTAGCLVSVTGKPRASALLISRPQCRAPLTCLFLFLWSRICPSPLLQLLSSCSQHPLLAPRLLASPWASVRGSVQKAPACWSCLCPSGGCCRFLQWASCQSGSDSHVFCMWRDGQMPQRQTPAVKFVSCF